MNRIDFKHSVKVRVRTYDVDAQGIVHNINYLNYMEIGRVEYRRNLGYKILPSGIFDDGLKVVVVHNSIDYNSFSYLDDILIVYTKISWIKNSSFCFEQLITVEDGSRTVCTGKGILVNLNNNNEPESLNAKFTKEIENFENQIIKI